jgi:hypothetical protein
MEELTFTVIPEAPGDKVIKFHCNICGDVVTEDLDNHAIGHGHYGYKANLLPLVRSRSGVGSAGTGNPQEA